MTALRLIRAVNKVATLGEDAGRTFARALSRALRDTEREIARIIRDEPQRTAIVKAAQANQLRTELRQALRSAGYDDLAETAYGPQLDRITAAVLDGRRIAQQSARLTQGITLRLEAIRLLMIEDLLEEGDDVAKELWQAAVRGIFGGRPTRDILEDLADRLDRSQAHIETLYDTTISIYGRQVEALQAGPDPEATFLYLGPDDEKTRPFCRHHVGKVYTRAAIDKMDNKQLDNPFLTGGGFNCRHQFMEVSKLSELHDLADMNQRIPEFEEAA